MMEIKLNVIGMVCGGCEKRVVNALSELEGVQEVVANHNTGIVKLKVNENIDLDIDTIKDKIEDIGFEVRKD